MNPTMNDPPSLGGGNMQLVLLRDPAATGNKLLEVCAHVPRRNAIPGSPHDVREGHTRFYANMDAAKFVGDKGRIRCPKINAAHKL